MGLYIAVYLGVGVITAVGAWSTFVRGEDRHGTFGDVFASLIFMAAWPFVWLLELGHLFRVVFLTVMGPCWWSHKHMVTVQNFGTQARRVGCLDCGKTFYVHEGMMLVVPWTKGHTELYRDTLGFTMTPWEYDD